MITAILVDDERSANKALKLILEECFDDVKVISTETCLSEAKRSIRHHRPDIVFLDIELPDGSGLRLMDDFPNPDFDVVFVTAYNEYAIQAIKKGAFDYLLKPVEIDELAETLERQQVRRVR
ncbi:MAG: response regulator, partial [Bacteroidota bacterium]